MTQKSGAVTQKVCSENLFALDSKDGRLAWLYEGGLIVNSTITLANDRAWFVEARHPKTQGRQKAATGRQPVLGTAALGLSRLGNRRGAVVEASQNRPRRSGALSGSRRRQTRPSFPRAARLTTRTLSTTKMVKSPGREKSRGHRIITVAIWPGLRSPVEQFTSGPVLCRWLTVNR